MKSKYGCGCITLIVILVLILTRCSPSNHSKPNKYSNGVYPVKIVKIKGDDYGDFILTGKTDAPNGSKILTQGESDKSANIAESIDDYSYAKVKNHKFKVSLDAEDLTDRDIKNGQKIKAKIFAIKKYSSKYEDYHITKKVQKIIAKQIDPINLTVNSKIAAYYADDDDDSDSSDKDDSDNSEEADDDSDDDSDDDLDDEDDSDNSEDTDDDDDANDDVDDHDTIDKDDSDSNRVHGDKIYTGDSNRIIGDKNTGRYHVPGQAGYYINSENVIYFNSEREAKAAGFVKSKR